MAYFDKNPHLTLTVDASQATTQLSLTKDQVDALTKSYLASGKAASGLGNTFNKKLAGSAGIAGAATAELGRTISDMPYGISAITNNVSQLGSMFSLLVSSAGGVKAAFKAMGATLMGPAGILIAFQAVVAIIDVVAKKMQKKKKDIVAVNMELESQVVALEEVERAFSASNASEEKKIDLLEKSKTLGREIAEGYKNQLLTAQEILKIAKLEKQLAEAKKTQESDNRKREEELKMLKEESYQVTKDEDKLERRKAMLRRKGLSEERIAIETANQAKEVAKDRRSIEERIAKVKQEQREADEGIYAMQQKIREEREKAEMRLTATRELEDAKLDLEQRKLEIEQDTLKESEVQTVEAQRAVQLQLFELASKRLDKEKERELANITDPKTIKLIEDKYKLLAEGAALDLQEALKDIKLEPIEVELKPLITGEDLLNGPELTESQKIAQKALNKYSDQIRTGLEDYVSKKAKPQRGDHWFIKNLGMSKEEFEENLGLMNELLGGVSELLSADAERQIALETNKTNKINDQLRLRLANEKLSADERDKINQQIAKNEAKLVEEENKINKKRFEQEKAFGIAQAMINTYLAASDVLAKEPSPSFGKILAASLIISTGLAQVAAISKQTFVGKPMPAPNLTSQAGAGGQMSPAFNVVGSSAQDQLAEAISSMKDSPIKTYVTTDDITSAQELDRKIVEGASI